MLKGQMAGLCCSTGLCNMSNGSGSLLLQADHTQGLDHPSWAAWCFILLGLVCTKVFFPPLQVSSCCFCWCSSISESKRKHAITWHLTMVPARSPPNGFRKWLIGQIPAFTRHKSHQAASFACWFGCLWMEQCIWGEELRGEKALPFPSSPSPEKLYWEKPNWKQKMPSKPNVEVNGLVYPHDFQVLMH